MSKYPEFSPDLTPDQMRRLGVLGGVYDETNPRETNFFRTSASMKKWSDSWIDPSAPKGWYEWYQGYASGKRGPDDERQIKRWASFKARHLAQLQKADPTLSNLSIQPRRRQALLNWGIAPGIDIDKALEYGSSNKYLEKAAMLHTRHKYVSNTDRISKMNEPVGSIKYDGANYFLSYDKSGVPRFTSRRLSVSGDLIDRTSHVPHLAKTLPQFAGQTFNVELIHTGHIHNAVESPTRVSGLLNSLAPKSIREQNEEGPIRAVIFDVIDPSIRKFKEKVIKARELEKAFGNPKLMFVPDYHHGIPAINALVASTAAQKREGVIVQDHDLDEAKNPRVKIKHVNHYNLRITNIFQEYDKNGNPKPSAGAVAVADATGRDMGNVGTGFDRDTREHIWKNQHEWLGKLIKVKAMKPTASKLRSPVYWGDADGEIDKV